MYTVDIHVGTNNQNMSVQVDMGSSDLVRSHFTISSPSASHSLVLCGPAQWLASKQCSSSACSSTGGRLYDPSTATATNTDFNIDYLAGSVSGPIYWDQVTVGGYTVDNQALGALFRPFFFPSASTSL